MKETSQSLLSFSLETVYPHTLSPHLTDGEKQCTPPLFLPTLQMGKNSVPLTLFPHLTDGEKQCTPHSFSPPYRWGKTVYPSLFFPTLQMGRKSELHSFSPSVRWKFESVPHTLFPHCNKMGKKSVPPTLFFPIIEGEKVQRVRNFTEPRRTYLQNGLRHNELKYNHTEVTICANAISLIHGYVLYVIAMHRKHYL